MKHSLGIGTFMVVFVALAGCGDDAGHDPGDATHTDHDGHFSDACIPEERELAQEYVAGLSNQGQAGLTVELLSADPAPPDKGYNRWTVRVLDPDGTGIEDADITVTPWMPNHGHGSVIRAEVSAAGEAGTYEVDPIDLRMAGLWRVRFDIEAPDGAQDRIEFFFCVEG